MKSNMCIHVEFLAGTSFIDAAEEASSKAEEWNVAYVKYNFNGVSVSCHPYRQPEDINEGYKKFLAILSDKNEHKYLII